MFVFSPLGLSGPLARIILPSRHPQPAGWIPPPPHPDLGLPPATISTWGVTEWEWVKLPNATNSTSGQGPTGTRYPTQTRSFFQYPIRTRFFLKIIGYFGYRVFQKTIFLTWKTLSRSYKILTNIILYHLHLSRCQGKL